MTTLRGASGDRRRGEIRFRHGPIVPDLRIDELRDLPAIADDGRWLAHVDLGALGTGDRWADIAAAAMSTEWNYGPGWENALIAAYGAEPDRARLTYYQELWNAT